MKEILQKTFEGERALFEAAGLSLSGCLFENGESPLKHGSNLSLDTCLFRWKYPLWYASDVRMKGCVLFEEARAGIWYTRGLSMEDCLVEAPKTFRRCEGLTLENVSIPNASETLWNCRDVRLSSVTAKGTYFGMNLSGAEIKGLTLYGDYCFDGAENLLIEDSRLLSKDCFWNSRNIMVRNSFISGEYLGWNSENLTLENCTIESLQGMCYIQHLQMKNCRLLNTTLAFEYSDVEAEISSAIDSVLNPSSGSITAPYIKSLILEEGRIDPSATRIVCEEGIGQTLPRPEWILDPKG